MMKRAKVQRSKSLSSLNYARTQRLLKGRPVAVVLAATAAMSQSISVWAVDKAWSTTPSSALFSGVNWTVGQVPGTPDVNVATTDALFFGTSSQTNLTNDNTGFTYNGFTFLNTAPAYIIGGNSFVLAGGVANNSTSLQTINTNFSTVAQRTFTLTPAGGNTTLGGNISGAAGGIAVTGTGTLTVSGNLTYTGATAVGSVANATIPTLSITGGTSTGLGNILIANQAAGSSGVLNQSGGALTTLVTLSMGNGASYGVYNMTGGSLTQVAGTNTRFRINNANNANSVSLMYNSGGTMTTAEAIGVNDANGAGSGGVGLIHISGTGTMTGTNTVNEGGGTTASLGIAGKNGRGEVTISGGGRITLSSSTGLGASVGTGAPAAADVGRVAVLNLGIGVGAGTLTTTGVFKDTTSTASAANAYVNFNGGILKAASANANFLSLAGAVGNTNAGTVTIHSGGATIDDSGFGITISEALQAPAGNGVTSIAVTGATGYTGAPYVRITGGTTGTPATAVANVDGAGNVTSITITNPGTGYTSAPTVVLSGGGGTVTSLTPTLGAVASGGLTKVGTGGTTLTGTSTYTGATLVSAGSLALSGTGAINASSGITVNGSGARFVQLGSVASTAAVTLTTGSVDGTGSIGAVTVGAGTGGIVANGVGTAAKLTTDSLTFLGAGALNLTLAGGATTTEALAVTNALTTSGVANSVTVNITPISPLVNSTVYELIDYGTFSGSVSDFVKGTGFTSRQTVTFADNSDAITVSVVGDSPKWTGLDNGNWVVGVTGPNKNWRLITAGTPTDYIEGDTVLFNDDATGTRAITISAADVNPTSTTFDTAASDYSVSGPFGIAGVGPFTKNGTGKIVVSSPNSYTGATSVNAGVLNIQGGSALGNSSATTVVAGAALEIEGGITVGNRPLTLNGAGLTAAPAGALRNVTGVNTYGGLVTLGSDATIQSDAGSLALTNIGTITGAGLGLTLAGAGEGSIASIIGTGAGTVTKTGAGTWTLSGTNTQSGQTTISGGTLRVANNGNLGSGTAGQASVLIDGTGATLATTGGVIANGRIFTIGAGGGTISVTTSNQLRLNNANTLAGGGTLTLTGAGTLGGNIGNLRVDQANTFNGPVIVREGGIFEYGANGSVGAATVFTLNNESELVVQGLTAVTNPNPITVAGGTNTVLSFENGNGGVFSGPITLNSNVTVGLRDWYANANVRSGVISGAINGTGGLDVNSGLGTTAGTLTLRASSGYIGATTVTEANVTVDATSTPAALTGTSSVTVTPSATANGTFRLVSVAAASSTVDLVNDSAAIILSPDNGAFKGLISLGFVDATVTENVFALFINNVQQPGGLYNNTTAPAGADPAALSYFSDVGSLNVAVPEPTSLGLIGLGGMGLLRRRRRTV